MCLWLVILGSCFANNTEKVIEELRQDLKNTKEGLIMLTHVIDSLKKEIDGMKNDPAITKATCKFAKFCALKFCPRPHLQPHYINMYIYLKV